MSATAFLMWTKGPGFAIASTVFILGVLMRLVEILWLRRKPDLAVARGDALGQAARTVFSRFLPSPGFFVRSPVVHLGGYIFHIGLFVVVFLFAPHIAIFQTFLGVYWPGLPIGVIDGATVLTIAALVAVMASRYQDPVRRLLTGFEDHLTWWLTMGPLLTGFLAVNRLLLPYEAMLALHLLTVELLLALFPFTKLMHAFTFVLARGYAGAIAGRKGAHS